MGPWSRLLRDGSLSHKENQHTSLPHIGVESKPLQPFLKYVSSIYTVSCTQSL